MWDTETGGFFWKGDSRSGRPANAEKHLYGQAFALLALSRYARASGDAHASDLAENLIELIETSHDEIDGGFHESLDRAWNPLPGGTISCIGLPAGVKSLNTHLHLLESYTCSYHMMPTARKELRIAELLQLLTGKVMHNPPGCCTDIFTSAWEPIRTGGEFRVSYGHDLELAWMLLAARDIGAPCEEKILSSATALSSDALEHGFDEKRGDGYKAGEWKSAYHSGRALLDCLDRLERGYSPSSR